MSLAIPKPAPGKSAGTTQKQGDVSVWSGLVGMLVATKRLTSHGPGSWSWRAATLQMALEEASLKSGDPEATGKLNVNGGNHVYAR